MVFLVWLGFEIIMILLWYCLEIFFFKIVESCLWVLGFSFLEVCIRIILCFKRLVICLVISFVILVGMMNKMLLILLIVFLRLV